MTLKMTAEEYNGVIKYLLSLPMSRADFPMLALLYAGAGSDTQVDVNLPSISSGLVGDNVAVKNRYLMPIASTTISATNGKIHNSYGYAD